MRASTKGAPRTALVTVALVTIALAVAGCARSPKGGTMPVDLPPQMEGPTDESLMAWLDFPVTAAPRPVVLIGELPRVEGFTTDEAKRAALQGTYELATALPATAPATVEAMLPDGKATVPVIDAAAAWEAIRTLPNTAQVDPALAPLKITKVELGTAEFDTDRGTQKLPAWNFTVVDGTRPISWPAMRPDLFWKLGAVPRSQGAFGATVSADGRNLTATMPAPPAEFCPGDRIYRYEAVVREGDTAVAVGLKTVDTGQVQPGQRAATCGYDLVLRTAPYPVSLSQPLGARVVVDTEGAPFAVTR